jgi:ABC-type lipoprotein release transport system permease subunit
MEGMLYGVTPGDPATLAAAAAVLALVALGASYLPARRAARVDPAVVLRAE